MLPALVEKSSSRSTLQTTDHNLIQLAEDVRPRCVLAVRQPGNGSEAALLPPIELWSSEASDLPTRDSLIRNAYSRRSPTLEDTQICKRHAYLYPCPGDTIYHIQQGASRCGRSELGCNTLSFHASSGFTLSALCLLPFLLGLPWSRSGHGYDWVSVQLVSVNPSNSQAASQKSRLPVPAPTSSLVPL